MKVFGQAEGRRTADGNRIMSNEGAAAGIIEVERVLFHLAKSFSQACKTLDRKNLDEVRELLESGATRFPPGESSMTPISSGAGAGPEAPVPPLFTLVSFRRYEMSELLVEFPVVQEDDPLGSRPGQYCFRLATLNSPASQVRAACLKVSGNGRVTAEFQIGGEIQAILTLQD